VIDTTKPVQTVRGRKVEILTVLPPDDPAVEEGQTIIAMVFGETATVETYSPDGAYFPNEQSMLDLVNTP
jgi:hypothetical protein